MRIRECEPGDVPALVEMAQHFLKESAYGGILEPSIETIEELIALVLQVGVIFVAELAREPVGMIGLLAVPHPMDGRAYADEVAWWVEPAHRRGLVGPQLLRKAEDWALARGLFMVKVTAPANTAVGAFYERLGYRAVETAYVRVFT